MKIQRTKVRIKAVNAQGIYDAQGKYWSWEEVKDSSNYEKIHDYQVVGYYMIKNGKE